MVFFKLLCWMLLICQLLIWYFTFTLILVVVLRSRVSSHPVSAVFIIKGPSHLGRCSISFLKGVAWPASCGQTGAGFICQHLLLLKSKAWACSYRWQGWKDLSRCSEHVGLGVLSLRDISWLHCVPSFIRCYPTLFNLGQQHFKRNSDA